MTVQEMFETLRDRLKADPGKVASLKASYQFELSGEGGGTYHAQFGDGVIDIGEGALESPGCTVTMSAADFLALAAGKLNPTTAFMTGKLRIKGDMGLAMKLQSIIG